jgi:hypothetical protein
MDRKAPLNDQQELIRRREESIKIEKEAISTEILMEDLALSHRLNPNPWVKHRVFSSINWGNPFF